VTLIKRKNGLSWVLIAPLVMIFSCTPPVGMRALIHMIQQQETYFQEVVVPPFEQQYNADIDVLHVADLDGLEKEMQRYGGTVGIVKVPFSQSTSLIERGKVKALDSFLSPEQLQQISQTYLLTTLGQFNGNQYLIPRKFETRIMVYSKKRVAEAVEQFANYRAQIDSTLSLHNREGLPATYHLEQDPNKWDYFDIYVVGWIWGHQSYDGKKIGRVAHRGKMYSGTSLRVVDRIFQCGGDSTQILCMRGDAVTDALLWESVYARDGIYNPRMWQEQWSGSGVWQGFSEGEVFLSFMTQLDCFFIHGTGRDGLDGYYPDQADLGYAVMPRGCSLELTDQGDPKRVGTRAITTGGWWWAIPADSPDPDLSYKLIEHITSTRNQIQGCSRFGMIPVRKDILGDMSLMFGAGWISDVYNVSFQQLMENRTTIVPTNPNYDFISRLYLKVWHEVVTAPQPLDAEKIERVLQTTYQQQASQALGQSRCTPELD